MVTPVPQPAALAGIDEARITDLDVRDDLRNGREPFGRIMDARRALSADGVLRLRAIFEPVPLYRVLEKQGLAHWTEQLAADDWRIWFYPADAAPSSQAETSTAETSQADTSQDGAVAAAAGEPVVLDVRGLEPPEPMVRTLEALAALPSGATLIQLNSRVPQMLLPQLQSRGYRWTVHEEADDRVRVVIDVP